MSYRPLRCLTAAHLRGLPRAQLERMLDSAVAAQKALETLIGMGCCAPQYANDRAICEHNRRLLVRQLGKVAA